MSVYLFLCIGVAWFMLADKIFQAINRIRSPSRPAAKNRRPPHAPPKGPFGEGVLQVQSLDPAQQACAMAKIVPSARLMGGTRIIRCGHPLSALNARHLGPNSRMRRIKMRMHSAMEKVKMHYIYLSIYLSIYLYFYLSIYLSIYRAVYLSIYIYIYIYIYNVPLYYCQCCIVLNKRRSTA